MRVQLFLEKFLNFFFPTTCLICKTGDTIICENCFEKIPTKPIDKLNILSVFEYRNKFVNDLLWQLKYHHNGDVAKVFAKKVSQEIKNWLKDFQNIDIIFIPTPLNIHDKRLNNHAEILAKEIAKYFPNSNVYAGLLEKNSTKKQAHTKSKHERMLNVDKKFFVSKKYIDKKEDLQKEFANKIILIVDDVTTTGATISSIRYTISEFLQIPEEKILGVTVAH